MKIYLATSWRNKRQEIVLKALIDAGHDVYDFKNPVFGDSGFHWSSIDPNYGGWSTQDYIEALDTETAKKSFGHDMDALKKCDGVVLLLDSGKSAHLEAGYAVGAGKYLWILIESKAADPELMYKMVDEVCGLIFTNLNDLIDDINEEELQIK